jgi:hypothetical protein
MSPANVEAILEIAYGYGKLYRSLPDKREETRERWERFCETYAPGLENFELADQMRMRFKQGCFANYL